MNKFLKIFLLTCSLNFVGNGFANEGFGSGEPKIKFVQCYPNPASTVININLSVLEKGYTITIYNFIGKKVEDLKLVNFRNSINLESYYRGLYIYQLRNKEGQLIESGKFQVAK